MLLITSIILLVVVFIAAIFNKQNIPLIILALAVGIIFGSDVTGIIYFDDAKMAQQLANIALIFILFAGGFGTKKSNLSPVIKPTMLLATAGVLLTANIAAILFSFLTRWPYQKSILLCSIISSTDAAAVFSILRSRSIDSKVSSITEIESASNDPMAILSTTFIIQIIIGTGFNTLASILLFIWQLIGGVGFGILFGLMGTFLFGKIKELDVGYFYIMLIGWILFSYSIADLCRASGMLCVFFAGFIMGNKKFPYKSGISSFTETLSFIANVGLFILLGLLVFPKKFSGIWELGVILFFVITFISRPITVFLCTFFTKLSFKEKIFISWSGLRGAVPIVLATYPAAAGIDSEHQIFNIIFFAVVLSIIVQGTTIGKFADFLNLSVKTKRKTKQAMELVTIHDLNYELVEIYIDENIYEGECKISDLSLPVGTTITMINRDNSVIAPSGQTLILPGDILFVLTDSKKIEEVSEKILRMFLKK
ncbi:MAG: potassium/proton antiporter [Spirochaetes bacterium]|nr:potassium/proton antiporter [Spirochaetota bacterium]NLJ04764.1 potassium/proton antiporter [Exilispira sp.]MBP8991543.1 potassium/proton antiporter [Spirochaetota bacterium]HOV46302.1 potassium/proton antiporter [Exilispira sp.]HPB47188.1 potassium/proton antiporter [Exilispira sp.]